MDLAGLCKICNKPAHFTCSGCGSLVCERHFKSGFCSACASGRFAKFPKVRFKS